MASKSSAAGSSGEATHPQGRGLVYGRANPSAFGAGLDFDPVVSSAVPSTSAPTGGSGVVAAGPLVVDGKRVTSPEDEGNAVAGQATSTAAAPGAPRTAGSSGSERARSGVMLGGDVTVGNGDRVGVLSSQLHDVQVKRIGRRAVVAPTPVALCIATSNGGSTRTKVIGVKECGISSATHLGRRA